MRRTLSICAITVSLLLLSLRLGEASFKQVVPGKGTETTLDIASWNIEWFGDTSNGPTNEALQLQNARDVIAGADMDIWGVAEIVSLAQWNNLKAQLPGFAGFIAKEPNVVNGAAFYSDFNNSEQNVGILYKTSIATVTDARVILTASDFDFAGRPPLQVTLRVTLNGATENIVVIVLHAKCCSDSDRLITTSTRMRPTAPTSPAQWRSSGSTPSSRTTAPRRAITTRCSVATPSAAAAARRRA